jgi:transcriptional regulator with XRE-family HTH domain
MIQLASNIRFLREESNLSQIAFAKMFDLTRGKIASYEAGIEPTLRTIVEISRHFDVSVDDLLTKDLSKNLPQEAVVVRKILINEKYVSRLQGEIEFLRKENDDLKNDKVYLQNLIDAMMNAHYAEIKSMRAEI